MRQRSVDSILSRLFALRGSNSEWLNITISLTTALAHGGRISTAIALAHGGRISTAIALL